MNGQDAPPDELWEEDENLELHLTDYSVGKNVIYAAFSWSLAEKAHELVKQLAQKHDVGFFDISGDSEEILLPDGSLIK